MSICIVASCGGHLTEVRALRRAYERFPHFYVLNERIPISQDMEGKTYFIRHAERDWSVLWNCFEAFSILRRERPRLILSTGAGPAVPFALVGRALGIPTVFVETFTRVSHPSLTGRIMYYLTNHLFFQWPGLARAFPKGKFCGPLI